MVRCRFWRREKSIYISRFGDFFHSVITATNVLLFFSFFLSYFSPTAHIDWLSFVLVSRNAFVAFSVVVLLFFVSFSSNRSSFGRISMLSFFDALLQLSVFRESLTAAHGFLYWSWLRIVNTVCVNGVNGCVFRGQRKSFLLNWITAEFRGNHDLDIRIHDATTREISAEEC